jgi:hypothetical protein
MQCLQTSKTLYQLKAIKAVCNADFLIPLFNLLPGYALDTAAAGQAVPACA